MNKPTVRKSGLRRTLAIGALSPLLMTAALHAQAATEPETPATAKAGDKDDDLVILDKFEVTGSRIPRLEIEGPLPVVQYQRSEIDARGAFDVADLLKNLPQNQLSLSDESVFGFTPGATGTNLRGVGVEYTLTLINGRRAAQYGQGAGGTLGFVNTASIPLAAIEKIEVLTDGASAIYGSDAVAGVQNFILRKDYVGTEVTLSYADSTAGDDSGLFNVNVVTGITGAKGNGMIILDYAARNPQYLQDRDYSAQANQEPRGGLNWPLFWGTPYGFPALVRDNSTGEIYAAQSTAYNTQKLLTRSADDTANWDEVPERNYGIQVTPEYERKSIFATYNYNFSSKVTGFLEASYTRMDIFNQIQPLGFSSESEVVTVLANNPYNPFGVNRTDGGEPTDVDVWYRTYDIGFRTAMVVNDVARVVAGVKGQIGESSWNWELSGQHYSDEFTKTNGGGILKSAAEEALSSSDPETAWNVFGNFSGAGVADNNEEVLKGLRVNTFDLFDSGSDMAMITANGDLFDFAGRTVKLAAGSEYRKETYSYDADAASRNGDILGQGGGQPSDGNRRVVSVYAELSVPVFKQLELQLAGRFEDYSDFGTATKPKISLAYRPTGWLMLRGSVSQGFRAPSLQQLFQGDYYYYNNAGLDPARGNEAVNSVLFREGGNPDLDAEKSESAYAGIVIAPRRGFFKDLSISVDFSRLSITDRIESDDAQEIVELNDSRVHRAVATPADVAAGYLGKIIQIDNYSRNKAAMIAKGIDYRIDYNIETDRFGRFDFYAAAAYLYSRKTQLAKGDDWDQNAGTYEEPKWRGSFLTMWTRRDWSANIGINYIGEYEQYYSYLIPYGYFPEGTEKQNTTVKANTTIDVGFGYRGFWKTKINVQLLNVFDTNPPYSNADARGFDEGMYSARGRTLRVSISKQF